MVGATVNNTTCTSNASIPITVSGVGTLSSSKQLLEIDLKLTSGNRLTVAMYLKDPQGNCYQLTDRLGDVDTYGASEKVLEYKFRAPTPCLNKQPDYKPTSTPATTFESTVDSRYGIFSTLTNISTALNGVNANGTWRLYFTCTNSSNTSTLPTVTAASLTFGSPISVAAPNPAAGTSCVNAVAWDGSPMCATTAGKVATAGLPSTSPCGWLNTSENNLWISFTPNQTNVCVNISGIKTISGSVHGVQSIIVESSSPCSGAWNVVNCPLSNIYGSSTGDVTSQNHCFTATLGKTYYLVIDGNGGAVSEFYITGVNGLPVILPVELVRLEAECQRGVTALHWTTASERNNDFFAVERSSDGENWEQIGRVAGSGNTTLETQYQWLDEHPLKSLAYYRLVQTDLDGTRTVLETTVASCDQSAVQVIPNPNAGNFVVTQVKPSDRVELIDLQGRTVFASQVMDDEPLAIQAAFLPPGVYMLILVDKNDQRSVFKVNIR